MLGSSSGVPGLWNGEKFSADFSPPQNLQQGLIKRLSVSWSVILVKDFASRLEMSSCLISASFPLLIVGVRTTGSLVDQMKLYGWPDAWRRV